MKYGTKERGHYKEEGISQIRPNCTKNQTMELPEGRESPTIDLTN